MSASGVWDGLGTTNTQLVIAVDVPMTLTTRAIDQAVTMATCRLRFLLAQEWKRQTHARVTARVAARRGTAAITA